MPDIVDPKLTPTWIAIYECIRQTWLTKGHAPSQSELQRAVNCSSASVQNAHRALKAGGYITRQKHEARSSKPTNMNVRLFREPPPGKDPWADLDEVNEWEQG